MRFTGKLVNELMADIDAFTEGRFKMHLAAQSLGGVGDKVRYMDYNRQQVWFGPEGARDACAYMLGGAFTWALATGQEIPEPQLRHMKSIYLGLKPWTRQAWELQGREWALKLARDEGRLINENMTVENMTVENMTGEQER